MKCPVYVKRAAVIFALAGVSDLPAASSVKEYEWKPSDRTTDFDVAAVSYSADGEGKVSGLIVEPEGGFDSVHFTGDNPFEFAPDAVVELAGGNVRFQTPVSADNLTVRLADDYAEICCSTNVHNDFLYKTDGNPGPVLLFPGRSIDDYEVSEVFFNSGAFSNTRVYVFAFEERSEGRLSFQAQALNNSHIKGARITLIDKSDGIYGSVDHVGYYSGKEYEVSLDDTDALAAKGGKHLPVTRSTTDTSGYGVYSVSIRPRNASKMTVAGLKCDISSLAVGSGTEFIVDGAAGEVTNATFSLASKAHLKMRNLQKATLTGGFSADNAIVSFECDVREDPRQERSVLIEKSIMVSKYHLLLENAKVDEITSVNVPYLVEAVDSSKTPTVCFLERSAGRLEFQVQVEDGDWLKGSQVELVQNGAHIFVRKKWSMYANKSYGPAGTLDMLSQDVSLKEKNEGGETGAGRNYSPGAIELVLPAVSVFSTKEEVEVNFTDTASRLLFTDTRIDEIESVYVDRVTGSITYPDTAVPIACFEKRSPSLYEFQLQIKEDASHVKASRYVLEQIGMDVYARRVRSYWVETKDVPDVGIADFSILTTAQAPTLNSTASGYYRPEKMDVYLLRKPKMSASIAEMGKTSAQNVTLNIGSNVTFVASGDGTDFSLPVNGTVNVDGMLRIGAKGAIGTGRINVRSGGRLVFERANCSEIWTSQTITLDGGALEVLGEVKDGQNYLNGVSLKNGGEIIGAGLRVGARDVTWSAGGESPSANSVNILCVSQPTIGNGEFMLTWDVDDVTGDSQADFFMNGNMTDFEDGTGNGIITRNGGMIHRKTGAGTLRWGGESTCTGLVKIVSGKLLLGNSKALNPGNIKGAQWAAKQPVEVAGGTLAMEPSVGCTASSISLSATGGLELPEGASFTVDEPGYFAEGARLNVSLGEGASFRFGVPLTVAQLRAIRVNGRRAKQLDDGSVVEVPPQLKLILR